MKAARTRFAPSPTGYLHVGGVRTALFAWLLARQSGGQFILRLEDTDKNREVEGSGDHIIKSLQWLGIDWDEGIGGVDGPHAPYLQSERLDTYRQWAQKLVDAGRAYADPYSAEEVQKFREEAQAAKQPFLYRNHRPENPPAWDGSQPLRFKSDPKPYEWQDAVMGDLHSGPEVIDDFILMKSDGYPTYNFAHIIDDHEMEVTHVIRGQEFLASQPNYLNLYEALEFERPVLAHMPHVLGPSGTKKLSKRDGAKDVLDYAREGYLPEALTNFIASLGWNDGTEQEIFSVDELIKKFSLDHIQRSGARFDEQRLLWMDGAHIRGLDLDDLYKRAAEYWPPEARDFDDGYKRSVLGLTQERLKYLSELSALTSFFFTDLPVNPELISGHKQLGKLAPAELKALLEQAKTSLEQSDFTLDDLNQRLNQLLEQTGQKPVLLFSLIRIASTQAPASPGLADTLAILGKERSLKRIDAQLASL
ncbi:MAG TPA: glutamate--tRNA ligase [Candidatus Saccharimonadales bacterium]|nr:glutamate--tRNA ligase [Candidatus Saccharimonadales bacterium]